MTDGAGQQYPSVRRITVQASVVLAPNPGPMTLDGTNSYVLGLDESDAPVVVVDPGPPDPAHLAALAARPVELILITHRHADHTEAAQELGRITGAPVRARDPEHCYGGPVLQAGERIGAGGVVIDVLATPGHTSDSVCFYLPDDRDLGELRGVGGHSRAKPGSAKPGAWEPESGGPEREQPDEGQRSAGRRDAGPSGSGAGPSVSGRPGTGREGSVLTGDTILGRGTTVLAPPDGDLGDYLASLRLLIALGSCHVLPAHGDDLPDLASVAAGYLAHREERLDQIRSALRTLGAGADVSAVTDAVYTDIDPSVRWAAEQSVGAQLAYLRRVR